MHISIPFVAAARAARSGSFAAGQRPAAEGLDIRERVATRWEEVVRQRCGEFTAGSSHRRDNVEDVDDAILVHVVFKDCRDQMLQGFAGVQRCDRELYRAIAG
jgi:hypothetical protein